MSRLLLAAAAFATMTTAAIAVDGPRAHFLLPQDSRIFSLTGNLLHTEIAGSEFGVVAVTPSYRHAIEVGGNAGALLIGIPVGGLSASLDTGMGIVDLETSLAPGDLFVGAELGFIGSPSLAPMDYAQYRPGFRAGVAAKLFLPTGDYDSSRLLNLGGNRWSLHASLPLSYVLADSMIDPNLTTFEIVPGVHIFGDNDEPFGGPSVVSQDPLWLLEAHVTHSFSSTVWAALDAAYEYGGETSADGVPLGDAHQSLALGATLGLVLSPAVAVRMTYMEQVYSDVPDTAARGFELTTAFRF